ncbi:A24 family peptidase [uncultured Tateyamaria sp.]|uniref:prepilin peptidase n=1 Tax=Tateyamaria sp. 1078 TaxID=3417464 RepID=UPI002627BB77|nr:A24 family peptidase [uncultured Tateyamaria sp.]
MRAIKHTPLIAVHFVVYALLWWLSGAPMAGMAAVFALLLVWISCRDFAIFEVPDLAAVLLMASGIGLAFDWVWALVGAMVWAGVFLLVQRGAQLAMGRPALGLGDVKLIAGVGAWLGPVAPIYVTLFASLGAIAALLALTALRREKIGDLAGTGIAFGPFLCLSAWAVWLRGVA